MRRIMDQGISREGRLLLLTIITFLLVGLCGLGFIIKAQEEQGKMIAECVQATAGQVIVDESEQLTYIGEFDTTFYCAGFGDGCAVCGTNAITSTGTVCSPLGNALVTIAVDPRVIPYGTKLKILWGNNIIYGIAEDTGGFAGGLYPVNRIDVCVANHEEALQNGIAVLKVYVID